MRSSFFKTFFFAAFLYCVSAAPAFACAPCLAEKSLNLRQTIEKADLIITGYRLFEDKPAADASPQQIKIQVKRVLKGEVVENQIVARSFSGMCPYGVILTDDQPHVLFLRASGEIYSAVATCSVKALPIAKDKNEIVTLDDGKTKIPLDELLRERVAPPEYKRIVAFLQLLKNGGSESDSGFNVKNGGRWKLPDLLSFISAGGLTFYDVNSRSKPRRLTLPNLRHALANKKDKIYTQLVHLAHIYNQPYPQYSTLSFQPQTNGVTVEMSGWYRLTFTRENGELKLSKLEYLQLEEH